MPMRQRVRVNIGGGSGRAGNIRGELDNNATAIVDGSGRPHLRIGQTFLKYQPAESRATTIGAWRMPNARRFHAMSGVGISSACNREPVNLSGLLS